MSLDDHVHATLEQHKEEMSAMRTEVAVIKERTNALEARTDRMMKDSAENRADMRTALGDILTEIRSLRDYQKRMEGAQKGDSKAELVQRWAIPAAISVIAFAKAMGWV